MLYAKTYQNLQWLRKPETVRPFSSKEKIVSMNKEQLEINMKKIVIIESLRYVIYVLKHLMMSTPMNERIGFPLTTHILSPPAEESR